MPCSSCNPKHPCQAHSSCLTTSYVFQPSICDFCIENYLKALEGNPNFLALWKCHLTYICTYWGKRKSLKPTTTLWATPLDQIYFGGLEDPDPVPLNENLVYKDREIVIRTLSEIRDGHNSSKSTVAQEFATLVEMATSLVSQEFSTQVGNFTFEKWFSIKT